VMIGLLVSLLALGALVVGIVVGARRKKLAAQKTGHGST
jgi:hypothetical protein